MDWYSEALFDRMTASISRRPCRRWIPRIAAIRYGMPRSISVRPRCAEDGRYVHRCRRRIQRLTGRILRRSSGGSISSTRRATRFRPSRPRCEGLRGSPGREKGVRSDPGRMSRRCDQRCVLPAPLRFSRPAPLPMERSSLPRAAVPFFRRRRTCRHGAIRHGSAAPAGDAERVLRLLPGPHRIDRARAPRRAAVRIDFPLWRTLRRLARACLGS